MVWTRLGGNQSGKLVRMRVALLKFLTGCLIVPQDAEDGSEVFIVTLFPEMMERLEADRGVYSVGRVPSLCRVRVLLVRGRIRSEGYGQHGGN